MHDRFNQVRQDVNRDINQDINWDGNQAFKQDVKQDFNRDVNQDVNRDVNRDVSSGSADREPMGSCWFGTRAGGGWEELRVAGFLLGYRDESRTLLL